MCNGDMDKLKVTVKAWANGDGVTIIASCPDNGNVPIVSGTVGIAVDGDARVITCRVNGELIRRDYGKNAAERIELTKDRVRQLAESILLARKAFGKY